MVVTLFFIAFKKIRFKNYIVQIMIIIMLVIAVTVVLTVGVHAMSTTSFPLV